MKKKVIANLILLASTPAFAQHLSVQNNTSNAIEPATTSSLGETLIPVLVIGFVVFMLITLVKYFLEFRLKNKLIDKGMSEQFSAYLLHKNDQDRKSEIMKLAILCCGISGGLTLTYFTAPIDIHSLAIMTFSIGISFLLYYFFLKRSKK